MPIVYRKTSIIKQRSLTIVEASSQMFVSQLRYFTTARSALQETFLYQERFIYLFNSACIFSQSRSNGCQAYRTTLELIDNRTKYLIVYLIQTVFVNIQRFERKISDLRIDAARTFHLRKVPHAAQQSIGNTRRTPDCVLQSPKQPLWNKEHPEYLPNDG